VRGSDASLTVDLRSSNAWQFREVVCLSNRVARPSGAKSRHQAHSGRGWGRGSSPGRLGGHKILVSFPLDALDSYRALPVGRHRCALRGFGYADEVLSEILPERALTPAEAKEMLAPVIDTLSYLHAKGLVHGRLKPSNILAVDDRLKLSGDSFKGRAAP